jgi:Fe(3+) dicitrate transport protein
LETPGSYFAEKKIMRLIIRSLFLILAAIHTTFGQDNNKITADVLVRTYPLNKITPDSIYGMRIVAGKKMEVVLLNGREMDLSTNNYRQVFRKTPGIFVSDHDASGLQTSISTRGLSANRSWEFNMRQNGYDIAADPSGYAESYYTPTLDAVANIEVFRGSSALQYGSQFGGMINYQYKDQLGERPLTYEGSHTAGSFGLFNSFNAIGGKIGNWTYYGFMHHRQAQGFRANSEYFTNSYFGKVGYGWKLGKITVEYNNSYYLSKQAGGLHDTMAAQTPDTSLRNRNWFELPWKMASIQLKHSFNNGLKLHATVNYLHGNRNSVGFLKAINIADTFNTTLGSYNHRDVDRDIYNTLSSEIRLNQSFKIGKNQQVFSGGLRYCLSDIQRLQKGIGSGGSDFDLSVTPDNAGKIYQRDLDLQTQNIALFAEQLFTIGKKLTLVPGYRAETIQASMSGRTNQVIGGYLSGIQKNRVILLGGLSAKYLLLKKQSANVSLYANANQNYRPVMYSELLPSSTTEIVDSNLTDVTGYSSEFGIKGNRLFRGINFTYDVNAFFIRYNNKVGTLPPIDFGASYKTNIGDLESKGIELFAEVSLFNPFFKHSKFTEQLNIYVSGTIQDARYKRWNNPSIAGNEATSIVGKKAEYAPEQIVRAGLEYKAGIISFSYQYQYTAACFSDAANTITPNQSATIGLIPAYGIHDLGISTQFYENYQFKAGINNLLNEITPIRRSGGYPGPGLLTNQGRSIYFTLSVKI